MEALIKNSQLCKTFLFLKQPKCLQRENSPRRTLRTAPMYPTSSSQHKEPSHTRTRSCCSPLLDCRSSFCLLCFFTGGERPRGTGKRNLKHKPPSSANSEVAAPLQKGVLHHHLVSCLHFPGFLTLRALRSNCPITKTASTGRKNQNNQKKQQKKVTRRKYR